MFRTAQYFIVFLLFTVFNLLFTFPAYAQEKDLPAGRQDLHNYTQRVMIEVTSSLTCMLAGVDPIDPGQKCLGINNGKIGPVDTTGGAIGAMGNLIAMTFTPPAHTGDYIKYLAGNFGLTKSAYAQDQGIGFTGLSPLTNIWIAFRNIVYLLFVLVFVIIGFAIMLRVRIDPRTVMTIENQIPKIIIGIILVTFSLAIAGFLIDLMWVLIYLSIGAFQSIPGSTIGDSFKNAQGLNVLEVANSLPGGVGGIVGNASGGVGGFISGLFDGTGGRLFAGLILALIGQAGNFIAPGIGGLIGGITGTISGLIFGPQILGFLGTAIAYLIIGIAVLFALFRLWFQLIKAYVMILVVVVFSPFWIIAGLIPGSKLNFESLLRELGSNLITFPATIIMFLLGKTFIDIFGKTPSSDVFVPPLIGSPATPTAIGALIGLGIILLTPDVVKMMRKALQAPEFDFSAIFAAIGVGAGAANPLNMIGRATQFGSTLYWARLTPGLKQILARMEGPQKTPPQAQTPPPHP